MHMKIIDKNSDNILSHGSDRTNQSLIRQSKMFCGIYDILKLK